MTGYSIPLSNHSEKLGSVGRDFRFEAAGRCEAFAAPQLMKLFFIAVREYPLKTECQLALFIDGVEKRQIFAAIAV